MKKIVILFVVLFNYMLAEAKYIRFAVNVSNTTVAQNDVYLTSNFQTLKSLGADFQSGYLQMTQHPTDTNVYYYTIDLPAFQIYQYQVEKGSTGYEKEWVPVESRSPDDYRWVFLDSISNDTLIMPEVLFGENNTLTDTMYRFQVDVSSEIVSPNGLHIAGSFQSNNPATTRMANLNSATKVYEYMAWLTPGSSPQFRYYNGNTSATSESVPSACATNSSRSISAVIAATVLPLVCFNSCTAICQPASVSSIRKNTQATLSPNPCIGHTILQFNDKSSSHAVALFDMLGRTIRVTKIAEGESFIIEKQNLKPGLYTIRIQNTKNEINTIKLIIE